LEHTTGNAFGKISDFIERYRLLAILDGNTEGNTHFKIFWTKMFTLIALFARIQYFQA
jgi:hypothetical protein